MSSSPRGKWDYVVIGSGFGGSVAALRLAQKGYRVAVVEAGQRWSAETLPTTSWATRKYLWQPALGCYGLQRMDLLDHILSVGGAGVGGGSLIYGNTLYTPLPPFFETPWIRRLGGASAWRPFYELAGKMMGVTDNPRLFEPDRVLRETAAEYGREDTFAPSPVGVCFGDPDQDQPDPYFFGEGPQRRGCSFCGACFVGCRHGAKNSLDRNYLFHAERLGVTVIAETEITAIEPRSADGGAGYRLHAKGTSRRLDRSEQVIEAGAVVVAAGVLGSLRLLWRSKLAGYLPRLSSQLGEGVRTNGEAILAVLNRDRDTDWSQGLAASSSVFPDEHTQVQVDRYPAGSDHLALLSTLLVDGGGSIPRPLRWLGALLRRPGDWLRLALPFGFARRSAILVVMQDLESSLRIVPKDRRPRRGPVALRTEATGKSRAPTYLPIANDFARRMARRVNGIAISALTEVVLDRPVTAHILGGNLLAESPAAGVVDTQQRAFGYPNLMVCDGSVIPTNLGVNPALSILAFTERAMSFIPPKAGEPETVHWLEADRRWGTQSLLLSHGNVG